MSIVVADFLLGDSGKIRGRFYCDGSKVVVSKGTAQDLVDYYGSHKVPCMVKGESISYGVTDGYAFIKALKADGNSYFPVRVYEVESLDSLVHVGDVYTKK